MNNNDEQFLFPEDEQESPCEHCEIKKNRINDFLEYFVEISQDGRIVLEEFIEIVEELYDTAYKDGEVSAYHEIAGFALHMAHHEHEHDEDD